MAPLKPVYLDNAATSHPKPESVYRAITKVLHGGGTPGRGTHQQTIAADRLVYETRDALCHFFNGADSSCFIFTPNATTAINQAFFGLLKMGDRVVTSSVEHNAVVRPLRHLQDDGIEVVKVAADPVSGIVPIEKLKSACLEKPTRLLVLTHCSNVIGSIQPLEGLGAWCREQNIVFMIDGAQSAGSLPIDLKGLQVDLFAAPGHKGLLGPQGTGFLYVHRDIELEPLIFGGTGTRSRSDRQPENRPERFESGTLNLPGLAGLHAALNYLSEVGIETVRNREQELINRIISGLQMIDGVTIYGPDSPAERGGVVSFNLLTRDPAEVGFLLDHHDMIFLRTGLHCAPDAHQTIGTLSGGTLRVSPGYFTTDSEIDCFLEAVLKLT